MPRSIEDCAVDKQDAEVCCCSLIIDGHTREGRAVCCMHGALIEILCRRS